MPQLRSLEQMMSKCTEATFIISPSETEPHNYMPEKDIITFKVKQQMKNLHWEMWIFLSFSNLIFVWHVLNCKIPCCLYLFLFFHDAKLSQHVKIGEQSVAVHYSEFTEMFHFGLAYIISAWLSLCLIYAWFIYT